MPAAPSPRERLSKRVVDAAVAGAGERFIWDSDLAGFGLRVTRQGVKSFVFQYRMKGEPNARRYTIGRYGAWAPDQARERCKELARKVEAGEHPREAAQERAKARYKAKSDAVDREFSLVADRWIEAYRVRENGVKRRPASIAVAKFAMKRLKDEFTGQPIDAIDRKALKAFFASIPSVKAATRRNVFAYARMLWGWAADSELVSENPFIGFKSPSPPEARDRHLSDTELKTFWIATRKQSYPFGPLFRLLALTGQRRSEVAGMAWEELDQAASEWNIPASRTKNRKPHTVHLSEAVIAELNAMSPKPKWPHRGLVFTVTNETPVSGISRAKRRLDAEMADLTAKAGTKVIPPWRLHDLRRTFVTGLQGLKVGFEVIEKAVNHISGRSQGGVAGVYRQYDFKQERREALDAWAAHIGALLKPKLAADEAAQGGSSP